MATVKICMIFLLKVVVQFVEFYANFRLLTCILSGSVV